MIWNSDVISLLQNHRSIRKYLDKKVEQEKILQIIQSAQMAPTSSHVQAYSIIGVTDQSKKNKLAQLSGNQDHVANCGHFLVFCADLYRLEQVTKSEGVDITDNLENTEMFIVSTVDAALAAQNAAIAAESLGLGIVYIGGIRNNPADVCELLNLPPKVYPVFGMCIGYPDQTPSIKPRLPLEAVYYENQYKSFAETKPYMATYNQVIRDYYDSRTIGKKSETWTARMSAALQGKVRAHMKDFLHKQGFPLK